MSHSTAHQLIEQSARAVNLAARPEGRPRWMIDEADVVAFEERRSAKPQVVPIRRQKPQHPPGFVEYFK